MKVLVVGSGGREHALCWKLAQSALVDELYAAPGNAGMAQHATCVDIAAMDMAGLLRFAQDKAIDYVVIGPEDPLVAGLADKFAAAGIASFGPRADAAILEGSKSFTKDFCTRHNIPTAAYRVFSEIGDAESYIRSQNMPIVIKADGLAAGKAVMICDNHDDAVAAAGEILAGRFGDAGREIVVEEFMVGEEASFFALCDGEHALPMVGSQDHKQVGDGDVGPNTGGMGAYSPAPVLDDAMSARTMREIIEPTLKGMAAEGRPFQGVLYAGLMITEQGPKLIEYNVRFGDPECQVIMARMTSDLLPALMATSDGELSKFNLRWSEDAAVCVVMASKGYPGAYEKGSEIKNLETAAAQSGALVLHAGTILKDGAIRANGGRVLNIVAQASDLRQAVDQAYECIDRIDWPQGFCRRDIAWRALARDPGTT